MVQGAVADETFSSGRLEIYINGQWGTICDDLFDQTDATVACKQLGFSGALSYRTSASGGYVNRSTSNVSIGNRMNSSVIWEIFALSHVLEGRVIARSKAEWSLFF